MAPPQEDRTDRRSRAAGSRRVVANADELLAEVLPLEQPDQLPRGVLQPVGDVLPILDAAFAQPPPHASGPQRDTPGGSGLLPVGGPGAEEPPDGHELAQ